MNIQPIQSGKNCTFILTSNKKIFKCGMILYTKKFVNDLKKYVDIKNYVYSFYKRNIEKFKKIVFKYKNVLILCKDGTCWKKTPSSFEFEKVVIGGGGEGKEEEKIDDIFSGYNDNLFCRINNKIYVLYGKNKYGELGIGEGQKKIENVVSIPTKIESLKDVVYIDGGKNHTLFLNKSGQVYGCGKNVKNQLGLFNFYVKEFIYNPKLLTMVHDKMKRKKIPKIKQIACGSEHSMILSIYGKVYSFGNNTKYGVLGLENTWEKYEQLKFPKELPECIYMKKDVKIVNISCGKTHSVMLSKTGKVYVFGLGMYGRLGMNHWKWEKSPVLLRSFGKIQKVESIYCGLKNTFFFIDQRICYVTGKYNGKLYETPTRIKLPCYKLFLNLKFGYLKQRYKDFIQRIDYVVDYVFLN